MAGLEFDCECFETAFEFLKSLFNTSYRIATFIHVII